MTPLAVFVELVDRLGVRGGNAVLISEAELGQWPGEAIHALKAQRIIVKAKAADSAVCPGCEEECVMPVHTLPRPQENPVSFIVCDRRSDTNRVQISSDHLLQWRVSVERLVHFVSDQLGLQLHGKHTAPADLWELGMVTGKKRVQMLCLRAGQSISLVAGVQEAPLVETVRFNNGKYELDLAMIRMMVDSTASADPRYTPNVVRRENRKLVTQAMYTAWNKGYQQLKTKHPDKSDSWIAGKIAKMEIAQSRDAETIRKHMKQSK